MATSKHPGMCGKSSNMRVTTIDRMVTTNPAQRRAPRSPILHITIQYMSLENICCFKEKNM